MKRAFVWLLVAAFAVAGCTTTDPYTGEDKVSNTTSNTAVGATGGAVVGALFGALASGGNKNAMAKGAIIGAVLGGGAGAIRGQRLDRQEAILREKLASAGVSVSRRGDNVVLNMAKALQFKPGQSSVPDGSKTVLSAVADVLKEFDDTKVDVLGYTDSTGSASSNLTISAKRAHNVSRFIASSGVASDRLTHAGRGSADPVAPNDTERGRALNRRVEIHIAPIS